MIKVFADPFTKKGHHPDHAAECKSKIDQAASFVDKRPFRFR